MPFSKPTFQGIVLSNGSTYVGIYRRVKKHDTTNVVTTEFYYMPTNAAGLIKNYRDNAVNGFFSSQSAAVASPPTGFAAFEDYQAAKHIGFYFEYPFNSRPTSVIKAKELYDEAIARGADYILVKVEWEFIFSSWSNQQSNIGNWAEYDDLIDYAASKTNRNGQPMKVALRLCADLDDTRHNDVDEGQTNTSGFYNLSDSARDQYGNVARNQQGSGHTSLAFTTGVNQALDFIQRAVTRYNTRLGAQFLKYSVSLTSEQEAGYNLENSGGYGAGFDYSIHAVGAFRTAMQTKYTNISGVNAAWGTEYARIEDIVAPMPLPGGVPETAYMSNQGKDWWYFQYTLHKNFQIACRSLGQTYAPGAKFCIEWGAVHDWARRLSVNVADNASYCDMMKAQLGILSHRPDLAVTVDIFRSNFSKKFGTELNDHDMITAYGTADLPPSLVENYAIQLGRSSIDNGATDILIMPSEGNKLGSTALWTAMMNTLSNLRAYMDSHSGTVSTVATLNYKLGDILSNTNFLQTAWAAAGGSNTNRINMVQSTDLGISATVGAFPHALNALHTFFLYSLDMKSKPFDFGTEATIAAYKASKLRVHSATHSITYPSAGDLAKTDWRMVGVNDGIVYIRNTQYNGYRRQTGEGNFPLNNNHPIRQFYDDNKKGDEDATFFVPQNQNYVVYMKNTGTVAITFEVDMTNTSDPDNSNLHRSKVNPGAEASYTINTAAIPTTYIKTIKINCNRWENTDSL